MEFVLSLLSLKVLNEELNSVSSDVSEEDFGEELDVFMSSMAETMYAHKGVGLAGVQVGRKEKILVADTGYVNGKEYGQSFIKMVNPEIIESSGRLLKAQEGCLSFPGFESKVERMESVLIKYRTPLGESKTRLFTDFEARVILHEIDHFYGVTLYNQASALKRKRYEKKITARLTTLASRLKSRSGN